MKLVSITTYCLSLLLLLTSCKGKQKETPQPTVTISYTDAYDLSFRFDKQPNYGSYWRQTSAFNVIKGSSLDASSQQSLVSFSSVPNDGLTFFNEVQQRIYLPQLTNNTNGKITFSGTATNITMVSLILEGIDTNEAIVWSKTVNRTPEMGKVIITDNFDVAGCAFLQMRIQAQGAQQEEATIAYNKVDITLADKPLDSYPLHIPSAVLPQDIADAKELPIPNTQDLLATLSPDAKVVALGKATYNNKAINELAYLLILEKIKQGDCKLVLLNEPLAKSLFYNRFVQDTNATLFEKLVILDSTRKFLTDIQSYNAMQSPQNKVHVYGLNLYRDFDNELITTNEEFIFDFLYWDNQEQKDKAINQFVLSTVTKPATEVLKSLAQNRTKLNKVYGKEEIDVISHIFEMIDKVPATSPRRTFNQGEIMFDNFNFLANRFSPNKQILTMGNSVVLNRLSAFPMSTTNIPLGALLHQKYGKAYSPNLILLGQGETTDYRIRMITNVPLNNPTEGSIEKELQRRGKEYLFLRPTEQLNKLVLSRTNWLMTQFYPYNLYQRYDGLFYINKGTQVDASLELNVSSSVLDKEHNAQKDFRNLHISILNDRVNAK